MILVERLAHYLAHKAGSNDVAAFVDDAAGILALIKDADVAMIAAGDGAVWREMIDAALISRHDAALGPPGGTPPPAGTDEEGDVPFDPTGRIVEDSGSWVQMRRID